MSLHNVPTEYYLPVSELTKKPGLNHSSLRRASGEGGYWFGGSLRRHGEFFINLEI